MLSDERIKILPSEHVFICGMTGTGKSVVAEAYLTGFQNVIKYDTKDETTEREIKGQSAWTGLKENRDFEVVRHLSDMQYVDKGKIVYAPEPEELNEGFYESFFKFVYSRQNTIAWIDELMQITKSATSYPDSLKGCYTRGRSKNVGIWTCTQRPSGVPTIALSSSTHFFVFNQTILADRKRLVETTGRPEFMEIPEGHNFWYYKIGGNPPVKAVLKL